MIALSVIFMDFVGFAIIWPIFSPLLFDASLPLLPAIQVLKFVDFG